MNIFGVSSRYVLKELVAVFVVVFLVLMLISFGSRFTGYLQNAAAGELSPDVLWLVLVLKMPDFVQIVVPFSLYLAVLLTLGRLDADTEMPIFQNANVGPAQVLAWFGWFVVPIVVLVAYLSFVLTPDARARFLEVITSQEIVSEFDVVKADTFSTFDDGKRMSYVGKVNREELSIGEVVLNQRDDSTDAIILAQQGRYHIDPESGTRFLELTEGRRYAREPTQRGFQLSSFEKLTQRIEIGAIDNLADDASHIPTAQLDARDPRQRVEWHWRLAMPVMTLLVAVIAVGLGRLKPRSGRFGKILPGLLIFVAYYALVLGSMNVLQENVALAAIGFWPVHALMGALGLYLLRANWRPV